MDTKHLLASNKKIHMGGIAEKPVEKLKFILKPAIARKTSSQTSEWLNISIFNISYTVSHLFLSFLAMDYCLVFKEILLSP
jgi:hypothetical protein